MCGIDKVDSQGDALAVIESGYVVDEIAAGAYEDQRRLESGERCVVA